MISDSYEVSIGGYTFPLKIRIITGCGLSLKKLTKRYIALVAV